MPLTNDQLLQRIQHLEYKMREFTLQRVADIVQVAPVSVTTQNGDVESVEGRPDLENYSRSVNRYQHAGFRSRPPQGSNAVVVSVEGGANKGIVVAEQDGVKIDPLDEGETKVYASAKPVCCIYFDKDGGLHIASDNVKNITIDAAANADVVVNGGSDNVACKGNAVVAASSATPTPLIPPPTSIHMAEWITTVTSFVGCPPPGDFGVINEGSPHFLAPKG